jgi:hypothetical protein
MSELKQIIELVSGLSSVQLFGIVLLSAFGLAAFAIYAIWSIAKERH